jgi:hypothetical protein
LEWSRTKDTLKLVIAYPTPAYSSPDRRIGQIYLVTDNKFRLCG